MATSELRDHLAQLHEELEQTASVDEASRRLLVEGLHDIQQILDRGESEGDEAKAEGEPGLVERLRAATRDFEESHPTLTTAVGRVADALSNLGI